MKLNNIKGEYNPAIDENEKNNAKKRKMNKILSNIVGPICTIILLSIAIMTLNHDCSNSHDINSISKVEAKSNKMMSDLFTNYFNKAYIDTGGDVEYIDVESWYEYDDTQTILIKDKKGNIWYTSIENCVLVNINQ